MLPQAFWISLRILFFRSGPEDLPYDQGRVLSVVCVAFGVLANSVVALIAAQGGVQVQELNAMPSMAFVVAVGVSAVLAMGLFTRLTLQMRQLNNRFQQTFNTLLLTSSVLSLMMVPAMRLMIPLLPLFEKLQAHPELAQDPATIEQLPPWTLPLSMLLLGLLGWQFAVTAFIYRRAANVQIGGGVFIALLCVLVIASFKSLFSLLFI
jgi:hypothetical protein